MNKDMITGKRVRELFDGDDIQEISRLNECSLNFDSET